MTVDIPAGAAANRPPPLTPGATAAHEAAALDESAFGDDLGSLRCGIYDSDDIESISHDDIEAYDSISHVKRDLLYITKRPTNTTILVLRYAIHGSMLYNTYIHAMYTIYMKDADA